MENCRLSICSIRRYTVRDLVLCIRILRIFRHSAVVCRTFSVSVPVFSGHEKYAAASFPSRSFIYPFRFVLFERLAVFTSACSKPGLNRLFPLSAQCHPRGAVIAFSFLLHPSGRFSSFATFGSPSSDKTSWFFMLFLSFDFLVSTKPRQNPGFNEPRLSIPSSFSSPAYFIRRGLRLAAGVQLTGLHRADCQRTVRGVPAKFVIRRRAIPPVMPSRLPAKGVGDNRHLRRCRG